MEDRMKGIHGLVVGMTLALTFHAIAAADEPQLGLDQLLGKWLEASQNCRTLDAKLARFTYDTFDNRCEEGRFYFEAPDSGMYQIGTETAVWQHGTLLSFSSESKQCLRIDPEGFALLN